MVVAFFFEKDEHVMLCLFLPKKLAVHRTASFFYFLFPNLIINSTDTGDDNDRYHFQNLYPKP